MKHEQIIDCRDVAIMLCDQRKVRLDLLTQPSKSPKVNKIKREVADKLIEHGFTEDVIEEVTGYKLTKKKEDAAQTN